MSGTLIVSSQTSDGTSLKLEAVSIVGSFGWAVVHSDLNGQLGPVVGKTSIPDGDSRDVVVPFDSPATTGTYWVTLHTDAGQTGTYEFPGPDKEVNSVLEGSTKQKITLTVQ